MSRVAIVTGGASGMGLATVEQLRAQGVTVVSFDVTGPDPVDVTDEAAVQAAVARVRTEHGPVDILVNCAGVGAGGLPDAEGYLEQWEKSLAVNLTGPMLMVRACIGDLVASGAGRIVNVASTEGLGAQRNTGPYTAAKHGLVGFTRSLAVDYGRSGVTANCICPGATSTGMTSVIPDAHKDTFARRNIPVGRYASPDEIAYMIVVLTSAAASFVNGAVIPVDGGMTARNA
ncbi:MAG: SDR family NAD(P)-dependent oxidoreductase [Acidimicrobiia bacterium]